MHTISNIYCRLFSVSLVLCVASAGVGYSGEPQFIVTPIKDRTKNYSLHVSLDARTGRLLCYVRFNGKSQRLVNRSDVSPFPDFRETMDAMVFDYFKNGMYEDAISPHDPRNWRVIEIPRPGRHSVYRHRTGEKRYYETKSFALSEGQIFGGVYYIWDLALWKTLGERLTKYKKPFVIYYPRSVRTFMNTASGLPPVSDGKFINIDKALYDSLERLRRKHKRNESEPATKIFKGESVKIRNDITTTADYSLELLLDQQTGRLSTFIRFTGDVPKNVDLKSLYTIVCHPRLQVDALANDYYAHVEEEETEEDDDMADENNWQILEYPLSYKIRNKKLIETYPPPDILSRKNTLTMGRSYIFGGECFIWELRIWEELGKRLKKYGKPFDLFLKIGINDLQDAAPRMPLKSKYIRIDKTMYRKMENLRGIR